ncbi:MAG TPA: energy-coupling factor transporter transmembrane protein EcfT [Firmicutes bacterium]|nr:energy-coupling factor transporter transmembrane protein EcfT [Bacillota bacterium]
MVNPVAFGQYLPGRSFLHRLNPQVKLISLLVLLVALFVIKSFLGLGLFLLLAAGLYFQSGLPFRRLVTGLRPVLYIILFTLVVYAVFTKGGVVLLRVGRFTIESSGVSEGLFMVSRLILLLWMTLLVTLTTAPLALAAGIQFFLTPLQWLRLPVAEVAMIMTIALRFIPTLMEESQRIMRAQMARGVSFDAGRIRQKICNLTPLIIPLFINAFRRADDLALAMEARGYRVGARRTCLKELAVGLEDWVTLFCSLAVLAGTVITGV